MKVFMDEVGQLAIASPLVRQFDAYDYMTNNTTSYIVTATDSTIVAWLMECEDHAFVVSDRFTKKLTNLGDL